MYRVGLALIAALCLTRSSSTAQSIRGDSAVVPSGLESRITDDIALRWRVAPNRVVLDWNRLVRAELLTDSTGFELRGQADGTRFSILFSPQGTYPFAASVHAGLTGSVPVATRPMSRGERVREEDVSWGEGVLWGDDVIRRGPSELPVGWTVRTSVQAGDRLVPPVTIPPLTVRAGEDVQVVWTRGGVTVALAGVALNNANVGEFVRVRLQDRRGNVRGVASDDGSVRLVDKSE